MDRVTIDPTCWAWSSTLCYRVVVLGATKYREDRRGSAVDGLTEMLKGTLEGCVLEIISGEGSADNPVLNNDAFISGPALNAHVLWNHDFGAAKDWNVEVGGSFPGHACRCPGNAG